MKNPFPVTLLIVSFFIFSCTADMNLTEEASEWLFGKPKLIKARVKLNKIGNYPDSSFITIFGNSYYAVDSTRVIFGFMSANYVYIHYLPSSDTLLNRLISVPDREDSKLYLSWRITTANWDSLSGGKTTTQFIDKDNKDSTYLFEINY